MGSEVRPARRSRTRAAALVLLGLAIVATVALTLGPRPIHHGLDPVIDRVLEKLYTWGVPASVDLHAAEFAQNIALFVPLGFLVALLVPRRWWWAVVLGGLVVSLGIESTQASLLPHRVPSRWDVVANSSGTVMGVGLAAAIRAGRARGARRPERAGHLGREGRIGGLDGADDGDPATATNLAAVAAPEQATARSGPGR